ncbi:chemotaxis protein [Pseudogracilibacillus auburnensis]|uniref:Two-component system chemotaxis response regulator CheV n=1 Tax=Pseudogracilibacillus auburnensis TaxID=1494959 RepID=A0A2V3W336_9BACI|nr:chemotaxis protein [Pseudogracilibacillus auburnensis]MBO1005257.1 chemotaxis protein CheV [Pseudogracilibacillus auburnensis]PXW88126.1 two-component system chemotaxis response regulator CheV [Pseudogracilibacillus auburnensis]
MSSSQTDILLESGTNELEVVMFEIGSGVFGINVLKVREIINAVEVTTIPNSHPNVEGIIRLREEVLPVVNLAKVLEVPESTNPERDKFIIAELNQLKIAFRVHHVSRIHRISWEQIEKPSELSAGEQAHAIGIIKLADQMSILLDFEKVVVEIDPRAGVNVESLQTLGPRTRTTKKIIVAEDSAILRHLLKDTLTEAGYENLQFFENGKEAWNYLEDLSNDQSLEPQEEVNLIITDIEMPQMDGHHLTDRVKKASRLKNIPVIVFSSLITKDLFHKGETVGASAQVSKPEIVTLVEKIDSLIL